MHSLTHIQVKLVVNIMDSNISLFWYILPSAISYRVIEVPDTILILYYWAISRFWGCRYGQYYQYW